MSSLRKQGPIPRDLSIKAVWLMPFAKLTPVVVGPRFRGDDERGFVAWLIPAMRRLHESPVPGRADEDLVDADPWRHAGDEGDGTAAIFRLQHPGLFGFRGHDRPQFQDRGCHLAGRQ